jgi:hypothetical protein
MLQRPEWKLLFWDLIGLWAFYCTTLWKLDTASFCSVRGSWDASFSFRSPTLEAERFLFVILDDDDIFSSSETPEPHADQTTKTRGRQTRIRICHIFLNHKGLKKNKTSKSNPLADGEITLRTLLLFISLCIPFPTSQDTWKLEN